LLVILGLIETTIPLRFFDRSNYDNAARKEE
jgi:hypothetical protein